MKNYAKSIDRAAGNSSPGKLPNFAGEAHGIAITSSFKLGPARLGMRSCRKELRTEDFGGGRYTTPNSNRTMMITSSTPRPPLGP